jgi:hypothetical protein
MPLLQAGSALHLVPMLVHVHSRCWLRCPQGKRAAAMVGWRLTAPGPTPCLQVLGGQEGFFAQLVDVVVDNFGGFFAELKAARDVIHEVRGAAGPEA